jgi:hypothetical protein
MVEEQALKQDLVFFQKLPKNLILKFRLITLGYAYSSTLSTTCQSE